MNRTQLLTSWRDEARNLLENRHRKVTYQKISDDTGLPVSWLKHFAMGILEDPGVNRIETLTEYLNARKA